MITVERKREGGREGGRPLGVKPAADAHDINKGRQSGDGKKPNNRCGRLNDANKEGGKHRTSC